jgi:hypothetical protein
MVVNINVIILGITNNFSALLSYIFKLKDTFYLKNKEILLNFLIYLGNSYSTKLTKK